jgi:uncharacterized membrane protein YjfL (UPF0719 family)
MLLDNFITGIIVLVAFFIIFFIGKIVNDLLHREYNLKVELVEKDNAAVALTVTGYYLGLVLSIGGSIVGPDSHIVDDLLDLCIYGILGIVLLNISWFICDKLMLRHFSVSDELIRDKNQGAGAVLAGMNIASGFIIFGALQGQGGSIWTAVVYWALGQIVLIIGGLIFNWITPYDIHAEIEKDNVAVGVGFGGALTAIGVTIGLSAKYDFVSWNESLTEFLFYAVLGLLLLPVVRFLTDKVLIPSVKLTDEIAHQAEPNVGAAYIECFAYISAAFIIHWCI